MKIIARHKWVVGAVITESYQNDNIRRFTATIRGFRNWKIYEGKLKPGITVEVIRTVRHIRDVIDAGNESIFLEKGYFLKEAKP